ncbi:HGR079Wp [Eremothecium sinecaudum]|uniref:6-phosphogluconolactonase-like protein n=1 Tax=Eremothecium sinecaudum TaxID=45286 RepID=A0A0X8HVY8_9SACH|nr:HGR079Wp [Eremothecium sinecaudum]AMD22418.1 HGR079Wp [Eremothecium sinecaudum]
MVKVYRYEDSAKLANELGLFILDEQNKALGSSSDAKRRFSIAVSGGSLVSILRQALLDNSEIAQKVQWSRWSVYFSDERLVGLDDEDSNYGAFKNAILDPLTSSGRGTGPVVYTINESLLDEDANDRIAELYAEELPEGGRLDLILLGCGPDGHTCSLFPGPSHKYLLEERNKLVCWCKDSPKPPSNRITFTMPVLEASASLAFVATGKGKRSVLERIFKQQDQTLPCALVTRRCDSKVTWFCDNDALQDRSIPTSTYSSKRL